MKNLKPMLMPALLLLFAFQQPDEKLVSKKSKIDIYSHTDAEDIKAVNYAAVSTINKGSGEVVVSVPMQSFEFKKSLMQKHFNSEKFLDTKTYPKAKFTGKIVNPGAVNYTKDGVYEVKIEGDLTIKGVTNKVNESAKISVNAGKIMVDSKMVVKLADYNILFEKGKPSTNIAKAIDVTLAFEF